MKITENELLKEADLAIRKYKEYINTQIQNKKNKTELKKKSPNSKIPSIEELIYREVGKYPVVRDSELFSSLYTTYKKIKEYLNSKKDSENLKKLEHQMEYIRNGLLTPNIRYVEKEAKKYQNPNIEIRDLISEGLEGLVIAFEKYDPTRGYYFLSYANWWVESKIKKALKNKSGLIKIPLNKQQKIKEIREFKDNLEVIPNKKPTNEELSNFTGSLYFIEKHPSLDYMPDDRYSLEEKILNRVTLHNILNEMNVTKRERKILLNRMEGKTLEEIGRGCDLTKERVRQIEKRTLKKIRIHYKKMNTLEKIGIKLK